MVRLRNITKKITGRQASKYSPLYSNKFIVQNYVKGFKGDYKVLVFADKFFVLRRENRDGSFTASGSGKSVFPTEANEIIDVLDFAELTHKELGTPVSSINIGRNRDGCHLIEFQCLFFGPYTLQLSPCYFVKEKGEWIRLSERSNLENEYCRAVDMYINSLVEGCLSKAKSLTESEVVCE